MGNLLCAKSLDESCANFPLHVDTICEAWGRSSGVNKCVITLWYWLFTAIVRLHFMGICYDLKPGDFWCRLTKAERFLFPLPNLFSATAVFLYSLLKSTFVFSLPHSSSPLLVYSRVANHSIAISLCHMTEMWKWRHNIRNRAAYWKLQRNVKAKIMEKQ